MNTRTHRTVWNYLSGQFYTVIILLSGLVATPFLLRWLGDARIGAFRASLDWAGYLGLLDLGVSGALAPMFARAVATNDDQQLRTVFWVGLRAYLKILLVTLVASIALGFLLPRLVRIESLLAGELRTGFWFVQSGLLLLLLTPFWSLVNAAQRSYLATMLQSLQILVVTIISLFLAHIGWGLIGQFLALPIGAAVFFVPLAVDGLKRYRLLSPVPSAAEMKPVRQQLGRLNLPTFTVSACNRVGLLTDNIVIAFFLGSPMVVPFYLTQRLATMAQSQIQSVGGASWAAMAELHVTGNGEAFGKRVNELTTVVMILGIAALLPISAYNHYFVTKWVGEQLFAGESVTLLASTNVLLVSLTAVWTAILVGTGHVRSIAKVSAVSACINLGASVIATWKFGLVGPLLGTLTAMITTLIWWLPLILHKTYGVSLIGLVGAIAVPLLWATPYACGLFWWAHAHSIPGWFGLCAEMALAVLVYFGIAWFLVLDRLQRQMWISRVRLVARRSPSGRVA